MNEDSASDPYDKDYVAQQCQAKKVSGDKVLAPKLYKRTESVLEVRILSIRTLKENRKSGANHTLESKKTLKKTERGTYNLCYAGSIFLLS